jgi:nitroimidazol reductase NimA-like FMN-containing flavoprotein (pyridoxamine 5'-phosphate oxidase superfamily)
MAAEADSLGVECTRRPVFEELEPEDCLELLADEPLGHVALTAHALPVVVPVNFAMIDGDIVWRSPEGTKQSEGPGGFVVAFEADHYDLQQTLGWSVMVQGLAHVMTDPDELDRAKELPLESWTLEGAADTYVRLVPNIVTGIRIRVPSLS